MSVSSYPYFADEEAASVRYASSLRSVSVPPQIRDLPIFSSSNDVSLAVVWQSGILAAAAYDPESAAVDLLIDIPENPSFSILHKLINMTSAVHIVVPANAETLLKTFLEKLTSHESEVEGSDRLDLDAQPEGPKLRISKSKEFALGMAIQRIDRVRLPAMPASISEPNEVHNFMASIIDFKRTCMVRAFGGLLHWLDQAGYPRAGETGQNGGILTIRMFSLEDSVVVDPNSQRALRVFYQESHPSIFKAAKTSKEGLSLFGIFNECRSGAGRKLLKIWFTSPTKNAVTLQNRHRAIRFFMRGENTALQKELRKLIGKIKDVAPALGRMEKGAATLNDWDVVQQTALTAYIIGKLVTQENAPKDIDIIARIMETCNKDLARVAQLVQDVVDFDSSVSSERFVVKPGIVPELDEMKRHVYDLNETLTYVAGEELLHVPNSVQEIRVAYIPFMGYLLVVQENEEMSGSCFELPGLEFMFKSKNAYFYKSARMRSLDQEYGDLVPRIHDMERTILIQMQGIMLRYTELFYDVISLIAELDCLMTIALVSANRNYVLPIMNEDGGIHIVNGRHPLHEICVSPFIANSTDLGTTTGRVQVLTGPNMSGKSVYLKQVAVIVFLAHVGCPVPASSASIQYVDKIFTRLLTEETVSVRQSAFFIELAQVALAVNYATSRSLVVLDEFGKGTRSADGVALLASVVRFFLSGGNSSRRSAVTNAADVESSDPSEGNIEEPNQCPFVILATHFHSLRQLVPSTPLVQYLTLEHVPESSGRIVFLYKLKTGVAGSSYASDTTRLAGFPPRTLERIKAVSECLRNNQPIEPLAKLRRIGFAVTAEEIIKLLLAFESDKQDARAFLDQILTIVRQPQEPSQGVNAKASNRGPEAIV